MQVAVVDRHDIHRPYLPHEDRGGNLTIKADHQGTCLEGREPLICSEKVAPQSIESLLPDEEELFSGLNDDLGRAATLNSCDDEDLDLFSSSGGMELEEGHLITEARFIDQSSSDYSIACENPSRTLVVKNVDSNVEDSELRQIFEQYGDIQTFCSTRRRQGLLIISYYDIRAARIALATLRNKSLGNGKLDLHYSNSKDEPLGQYTDQASLEVVNCDSSISSTQLLQIFGSFGEIEEICATTTQCKHIKYYDIRAAEAAFHGLSSTSMLQEHGKLEIIYPGCAKSLMRQCTHGLVQGQLKARQSPNGNSLPRVEPSCMKEEYIHGVHSVSERSINVLPKSAPAQANCCFTNNLPSAARTMSIYNQFGLHEPRYSLDQAKVHNHCTSFNPHSFPVNCGGFVDNGVATYDSLSTTGDLAIVGSRTTETNDKHFHTVGSYGSPMEYLFQGSSRTGSLPLGGHHHFWNRSNSFQQHHLTPVIWSHSPPFINGVCGHGTSKLPVILEVLPPVLYTISPTHKQHVMSAPSGSLSCEGSEHAYVGESLKANHHLDPLRLVGFPTTMSYPSKAACHDFSQAAGDCMDATPNSSLCSSQIISHKSPERETETASSVSFSRPRGRLRRLSHRRHETASCHTDEKKYELDIERVLRGEDSRTTLMIKNIPNKYSSETLLAAIDEHNQGTYDFIYLPLDFKNKCNMGYAFINMIDPLQIVPFYKSFNGKKWEKFHSGKVACLAYARIQGKAALIAHFQESSLMNEDKCCHPILFVTDGPNAGNQEPFPLGSSIQSRRHRSRCSVSEANQNQEISTSLEGETSYHRKSSI